jgi:hypothetical protein
MLNRFLVLVGTLTALVVTGILLAPVPLAGQNQGAKAGAQLRTPWGDPDLQGDWDGNSLTPLQRPSNFKNKAVLTPAEEAKVVAAVLNQPGRDFRPKDPRADVAGAYNTVFQDRAEQLNHGRTSLVVDPPDGRIPPLLPEIKAAADRDLRLRLDMRDGKRRTEMAERYNLGKFNRADGPEDRGIGERCLGQTLPVLGGAARITQSKDAVSIYYAIGQGGGFSRIIPITNAPHLPSYLRSNFGDARGHWEGNTLVVDITNFDDRQTYQGSRETKHLIEHFRRIDADTLEYKVTMDDPKTWTKPWTAMILLDKIDPKDTSNVLTQQTCHEGNYGIVGILSGHRAAEKAFAEGKGPDPFTMDTYSGGGAGEFDTAGGGIEIVKEE